MGPKAEFATKTGRFRGPLQGIIGVPYRQMEMSPFMVDTLIRASPSPSWKLSSWPGAYLLVRSGFGPKAVVDVAVKRIDIEAAGNFARELQVDAAVDGLGRQPAARAQRGHELDVAVDRVELCPVE
jgi:hypothetical protein